MSEVKIPDVMKNMSQDFSFVNIYTYILHAWEKKSIDKVVIVQAG